MQKRRRLLEVGKLCLLTAFLVVLALVIWYHGNDFMKFIYVYAISTYLMYDFHILNVCTVDSLVTVDKAVPSPTLRLGLLGEHQSVRELSTTPASLQFQKRSNVPFYSSQNQDLEDELFKKDSLLRTLFQSMERDYPLHSGIKDYYPLINKYTYQVSTYTAPATGQLVVDGVVSTMVPTKITGSDIWKQLGISVTDLLKYNENLRLWISKTILEPLVEEINKINESLTAHGLADFRIGESSPEKLRRTCQLVSGAANISSLVQVLPYLEVTRHQEYLVRCLDDLASGGCMSSFRSDGGSKRKGWNGSSPTDSAVVMHCLATYLDSQLPAPTDWPDRRPFSGHYFVKCPEKPPVAPANPVIVEVQLNPPHYKLIMGSYEYEFPKGRNNMLHTVILFFWLVKTKMGGRLSRISMDKAGLNINRIFD